MFKNEAIVGLYTFLGETTWL